jgi:hypothetical protein
MLHDNIGYVLKELGRLPEALESYKAALAIRERLAKAEPGDAERQSDLKIAQDNVANVQAKIDRVPANKTRKVSTEQGRKRVPCTAWHLFSVVPTPASGRSWSRRGRAIQVPSISAIVRENRKSSASTGFRQVWVNRVDRNHLPPFEIPVRLPPDSRHQSEGLEELSFVPGSDSCTAAMSIAIQ